MIVIDTETTGLGERDQVIEMALVWAGGHDHFLIRPTVPICPEARAAHHIPDKLLASCADAVTWRRHLEEVLAAHPGPLVGHNVKFDLSLIRQTWPNLWPELPQSICTYRCALHLWPEAPAHGNQVLRYWLGVEPMVRSPLPPHRALPDAAITYALVTRMLETRSEEELIAMSLAPVLLYRVKFGKHRELLWSEVPRDYLAWIVKNGDFDADVIHTARYYLRR